MPGCVFMLQHFDKKKKKKSELQSRYEDSLNAVFTFGNLA